VTREDDEKWLDINFDDFEKELQGKKGNNPTGNPGVFGPERPSGFGDAKTQADLKKMVERFEAFLNDEDAGVDGAELDDMDFDDEEDDDDDDSEDEDKDVSFDEEEFAKLMREMMGMPSETVDQPAAKSKTGKGRIEKLNGSDEEDASEDEAEEMKNIMQKMEAELNEAGALNLDPTPKKPNAFKGKASNVEDGKAMQGPEDDSDEELDIDFNLAKNLLESFKSQGGLAGPGSNLLGMMGMQLPRDEDDSESAQKT